MTTTNRIRRTAAACAASTAIAAILLSAAPADAASVEFRGNITGGPGSGIQVSATKVHTFADEAGVRVIATNTGPTAASISLVVTDERRNRIAALVNPAEMRMHSGGRGEFVVVVPMDERAERRFRVCAAYSGKVTAGQCSTVAARKIRLGD